MPRHHSAPALHAEGLTKRYGRRPALTDCQLEIPAGRIIGLVGPNGAGKSTLLQLACGLITPTSGSLRVLGAPPAADAAHLARVSFVAQDMPVYAGLSVADHLRMGARLNPGWDAALAGQRIARLDLDPGQRAGRLSGGQRAQLALTIAAAKRPELLMFDEPAAALDPLARSGFLRDLTELVTQLGASAVFSSHLLADVERVCDYLVVLGGGRVQLAGDVRALLATHHRLVTPPGGPERLPARVEPVWSAHTDRHRATVVRGTGPLPDGPWRVEPLPLEELVLSYLSRAAAATAGYGPAGSGSAATAREVRR
ncbi:ABC transporter ATP-binding protein [Plantactinospora sonchi]|uniref:ABC transporter ATP-binding protein n=1 Tax=Plantactinospora sonchi TaxID=1544735 RepID=A0ABU7RZ05_9ACTN